MLVRPFIVTLLGLTLVAWPATAQTSRPVGIFENQAIRRGPGAATPTTSAATPSTTGLTSLLDMQRVVLALAVVLCLILGLRWTIKRFFPNAAGARGNGAVRVLSRSALTPRQHVLLVQVGRRVLVVADNGTQLSPLSEIHDSDEVAQLIGQLTSPARRGEFEAAFGSAERDYAAGTAASDADSPDGQAVQSSLASTHGEIQGLMTKVRELARQFGR